MPVSVFDLFSIGIGPSSSHTVGPMRAAGRFVAALDRDGLLPRTTRVRSELFGSLGATGHGHGSYNAVLWGLEGEKPETVDTTKGPLRADEIRRTGQLRLERHPLGRLRCGRGSGPAPPPVTAIPSQRHDLHRVRRGTRWSASGPTTRSAADSSWTTTIPGILDCVPDPTPVPYPFRTGTELLGFCTRRGPQHQPGDAGQRVCPAFRGRGTCRPARDLVGDGRVHPDRVLYAGVLPGGLKVRRRAADLYQRLIQNAVRLCR